MLNTRMIDWLRARLGSRDVDAIEANARAAQLLEESWLNKLDELFGEVLGEVLDSLAALGPDYELPDDLEERIGGFLLEHQLEVTKAASHTVAPAEYIRAAKSTRWPSDLARVRALWDTWRHTGKLPGKTKKEASAIKALYIRRVNAVVQQRAREFFEGRPAKLPGSNQHHTHWNPSAFDREDARRALEAAAKVARDRARTIVETETTRYYNHTRTNVYDQVDSVAGYLFVCVRDAATTKWCKSRGGVVFFKGSDLLNKNKPPCHWNCRSELLPLSRLNPRHRQLLEDRSLWASNRRLVPLPPGWNESAG